MRLRFVITTVLIATPAAASGTLDYGTKAGQVVDVISMSGINTNRSVITTRHSRDNAIYYCRDYVGKLTEECIQSELSLPINDQVSANCFMHTFTDFFGGKFRVFGPLRDETDDVKIKIIDQYTNEVLLPDNAHNYFVNAQIFKALCPASYYSSTQLLVK